MLMLFITLLKPILASENCLLFDINRENSTCLFCKKEYYNSNLDQGETFLSSDYCLPKSKEEYQLERIVYILPNEIGLSRSLFLQQQFLVYENLQEAFFMEDLITSKVAAQNGIKISFLLLKGDHFILPKYFKDSFLGYFIRNQIDIQLLPLECREAPIEMSDLCYSNDSKATVFIKSKKFVVFISRMLSLINISFDGIDLQLSENGDECSNFAKICCPGLSKFCEPNTKYSIIDDTGNTLGIFTLETVIDDDSATPPVLNLENVNFKMFEFSRAGFIHQNKIPVHTLIMIYDFEGNVSLKHCTFEKLFFTGGLLQKIAGIRQVYQPIISTMNLTKYAFWKSKILIQDCFVVYYNSLNGSVSLTTQNNDPYRFALFELTNYKGDFNMRSSKFNHIFLPYGGLICFRNKKFVESLSDIILEQNEFFEIYILFLTALKDYFQRFGLSVLVQDNIFRENIMLDFLILDHIKNFTLKGSFSLPFRFPISSFIQASYSNLLICDSNFERNPETSYPLITIKSLYEVSNDVVFTLAKRIKGICFSNETTLIRNTRLSESSLLLFKNLNLNYKLSIEDSIFENLILESSPFIELLSEGKFSLKNVTFSNISTTSSLVYLILFLNASIHNLTLNNIKITNGKLFWFRSNTECNPSEHQINISLVQVSRVIFYIANNNLGSYFGISILYLGSTESGKAASANLSDIYFENIVYSRPHINNQLLYFDCSNMSLINFKSLNISNGLILIFNSKVSTGELLLDSIIIETSYGHALVHFFECGIAAYTKFELKNSRFFSQQILSNQAADINLAQSVIISNVSFELIITSGTVLFAQANKISKIFIDNLRIKTFHGSRASLLTIITQNQEQNIPWTDHQVISYNLENQIVSYGIKNSVFETSFGSAVVLLMQSELIFISCVFKNTSGIEGAALKIAQSSKALIFKTKILNCFSEKMGGCLNVEDSLLILIQVEFRNSASSSTGGCINAMESVISLVGVTIDTSESAIGGSIFMDFCNLNIIQSEFYNSKAFKYGGIIVMKQGNLIISNCLFKGGTANYYGAAIYIEYNIININNSEFISCKAKQATVYATNAPDSSSFLINIKFLKNIVDEGAAIGYFSDFSLTMKYLDISDNEIHYKGFVLLFLGLFTKPSTVMEFIRITGNKAISGLIYLEDSELSIGGCYFFQNSIRYGKLIDLSKSYLKMNSTLFLHNPAYYGSNNNQNSIYLIEGRTSRFSFENSFIDMRNGSGFLSCSFCESIKINKSFYTLGSSLQGSIFKIRDSAIIGILVCFKKNRGSQGSVLYSLSSSIIIEYSCFYNNFGEISGSDIFASSLNSSLQENLFLSHCVFFDTEGITIEVSSYLIHMSSIAAFGKNKALLSQVLLAKDCRIISIETSHFQFSKNDSTVRIASKLIKTNIYIKSSYFGVSNFLTGYGGFLSCVGTINASIDSSVFHSGKAYSGGALFIFCREFKCSINISNTAFTNNYAAFSGGAIKSDSDYVFCFNTTFVNNTAIIGIDTIYSPKRLKLVRDFNRSLVNDRELLNSLLLGENAAATNNQLAPLLFNKPGDSISLMVIIVDKNNNIQFDQENFMVKFMVLHDNSYYQEVAFSTNQAKVYAGLALFENIFISGPTNATVRLEASYENPNFKIKETFQLKLLPCERGDIYSDLLCQRCPENYYSLSLVPKQAKNGCSACPENAYCPGGAVILPAINYWRMNANSSMIIKCKVAQACPLQSLEKLNNVSYEYLCAIGYEGNLCQECSFGYGRIKSICVECQANNFFLTIILFMGYVIYIFYILFKERKCSTASKDFEIALLRILMDYLSIFILMKVLEIKWSEFFEDFFSISSMYVSTSPSSVFSMDCVFSWRDKDQKLGLTLVFAGMFPFLLACLLMIFDFLNSIRLKYRKKENLLFKLHFNISWLISNFLKHLSFVYMNVYPNLFHQLFKVMGCQRLEDFSNEEEYLINVPWIKCFSEDHISLLCKSIPFLLFWGIITPLSLFYFVFRYHNLKKNIVRANFRSSKPLRYSIELNRYSVYNLFTRGYSKKFFMWESSVVLRKLGLFLFASFSKQLDKTAMGGFIILLLTMFLLTSLKLRPYVLTRLNYLEVFSLWVSISVIGMGIIASYPEVDWRLKHTCSLILIILHVLFLVIWTYYFLRRLRRVLAPISAKIISTIACKLRKKLSNKISANKHL